MVKKRKELLDREFTGEEDYVAQGGASNQTAATDAPKPELLPYCPHAIEYQIGGLDPVIEEVELDLRPNPSNTIILDALMIKRPHLTPKRPYITILRANAIRI